jgi:hypothetical protein
VSERKIDRLVEKYAKDLSYPKQTLEGEAKKKAEQKIRRDKLIKEVSDKKIEGKIRDVKKGVKGIDLAHKASLRQFKDLGLEYYVDNLGFDKSKVNQELIIPTEQKLESLHKQRMNILKKVKPNKVPKSVQKELEKINLKMSKLSLESDGVLQAVLIDEKTLKPFVFNKNYANVVGQGLIDKPVKDLTKTDIDFIKSTFPQAAKTAKAMKIPTATDSKNIAKKLASFGFKCKLSDGTTCNNPMAYLDDIKKQQAIAKGSGNAAANAAKKLSAGKAIMREFIGPAALTFELAAAVPLGYLSYKAGLPPARIANQLTYGAFGDTETARLKKEAIKLGIDTSERLV